MALKKNGKKFAIYIQSIYLCTVKKLTMEGVNREL